VSDSSVGDGQEDLDGWRRRKAAAQLAVVRGRAAALARDAKALTAAAYEAMQASRYDETTEYLVVAYAQAQQMEREANALRVLVRADRDAFRPGEPQVTCPDCGARIVADVIRHGGSVRPG
jgi:hypothetical protein